MIDNLSSFSDTLAALDLRSTLTKAAKTFESISLALEDAANGKGTLGKLLKSDSLHNELIQTTQSLQDLVNDIELHQEKYIHFSIFGKSQKGIRLTQSDEEKLRDILKNTAPKNP